MRRLAAGVLCAALLASAHGADAPPAGTVPDAPATTPAEAAPPLEVPPNRLGYAFEQPEILIRQRLFGLAHGLSLLAAACLDMPAYSASIQDAYAAWHARQGKAIETIVHDLARYYFGSRADEARWPDLSRALNLTNTIEPALGEVTLHAACASLPEAIARPRYALDKLLAEGVIAEPGTAEAGAASPDASSGVSRQGTSSGASPAPTFQRPAE